MNEPDYRLFLRDGDLVTAEDVLKWLRSPVGARAGAHRAWLLKNDAREWAYLDHYEDETMLAARLDRERRRALRRGAKHHWTWFSCGIREYERRVNQEGLISDSDALESLEIDLSRALAFRAAARAK